MSRPDPNWQPGLIERVFGHRHREQHHESPLKPSVFTGVPVQVSRTAWCRCGLVMNRELTPAGLQQVDYGAKPESLFGDGPIELKESTG